MLNGYFGNTGAGKTYGVVEYVVIPSLKEDRLVITNIPLEGAMLTSLFGGEVRQLPANWFEDPGFAESIPNGSVLILDEVWRKWPSGQNVRQVPVNEMALLKEHRHRVDSKGKAMRVVLVSQFPSDLASWTRKLIDTSFHMTKLNAIGMSKTFHVDVVKGCPTGDKIPKKLIIQTRKGTYKPEIYQYYRSATTSETGSVGDETVADRRGLLWTSKWFWFCAVFGLLAVVGGPFYVLSSLMHFNDKLPGHEKPLDAQTVPVSLVNPPPPALSPASGQAVPPAKLPPVADRPKDNPGDPPASTFWRVAGFLENWRSEDKDSTNSAVLLAGPNGERRIVPISDCKAQEGHLHKGKPVYYFCDVAGERVTFWSGQQNINAVIGAVHLTQPDAGVSAERREASTPASGKVSMAKPVPSVTVGDPANGVAAVQQVPITVVPDTEYGSRPWRGNDAQ